MDPGAEIVVVRAFLYPIQAQLALSAIVAAGIEARLADEHIISIDWTYATAVGWVKVVVRVDDVHAAREVLDEAAVVVADEGAAPTPNTLADQDADRCASCGSADLEQRLTGKIPFVVTWFALGVPLWIPRPRLACRACGTRAF